MDLFYTILTGGAFICALIDLVFYKRYAVYNRILYTSTTDKKEFNPPFRPVAYRVSTIINIVWGIMSIFMGYWLLMIVREIGYAILYQFLLVPKHKLDNNYGIDHWIGRSDTHAFLMGVLRLLISGYVFLNI